jgi:hypothetical protein
MRMATIEVLRWREDYVGFTGWDDHARSELKKRLRRGLHASPKEIKRVTRAIHERQLVTLCDVHDEAASSLVQILETTGADVRLTL